VFNATRNKLYPDILKHVNNIKIQSLSIIQFVESTHAHILKKVNIRPEIQIINLSRGQGRICWKMAYCCVGTVDIGGKKE